MRRIANTWELMKSSWRILMRDKALLILPLISGVAGLLVLAAFFLGVLAIMVLGTSGVKDAAPYILVVLGGIMWVVGVGVVMTALKAIFDVVLYLYTKTGKVPEGFSARNLRSAIATA